MILVMILAVMVRLSFLIFSDYYLPLGTTIDTGIHRFAGEEIATFGQIVDPVMGRYEAFFPFLTSYSLIVGMSMKIFGVTYLAILIPNIIFDLIAATAIYSILYKWKANKTISRLGATLWLLNPLTILFCTEGTALTVVNMFIALSLLNILLLLSAIKSNNYGKIVIFALTTSFLTAAGNSLRAVFTIFLIALFLVMITYYIRHRSNIKSLLLCLILLSLPFYGFSQLFSLVTQKVNPYYERISNTIGWNVFVGANYNTEGRWSVSDWEILWPKLHGEHVFDDDWDPTDDTGAISRGELQLEFLYAGIERYANMGPTGLVIHLLNKTEMLFGEGVQYPAWNIAEQFTNIDGNEGWLRLLHGLAAICHTLCIVAMFVYVVSTLKSSNSPRKVIKLDWFLFFLLLSFCGLFAAALIPEVMARYMSVFWVVDIIFLTLALWKIISRKHQLGKIKCK